MLTALQENVASILAGLPEAEDFALAGGAALIARGEVQRQTRDLDFFGLTPAAVDRLATAVDKVLAIFGRAEARDFIDLAAVEANYGLDRLFRLAAEKDRGFTRAMFADMAGRFSRLRTDGFDIGAAEYEELARRVDARREQARNR